MVIRSFTEIDWRRVDGNRNAASGSSSNRRRIVATFPEQLKSELVVCFRFSLVGKTWKRRDVRPTIVRLANQDCNLAYSSPKLLGRLDDAEVEVRLHDDAAIDITCEPTLLGDWNDALVRCEDSLEAECRTAPGHAEDLIERSGRDESSSNSPTIRT